MKPSIFVSIPNYRDSECPHTIKDLYNKASGRFNIVVGVGWQLSEDDNHTVHSDLNQFNLRNIFVDHSSSKGCCWMRSRIYKELYNGETYFFAIDSHSRFAKSWDEQLVGLLKKLPPKSIISTYPNAYEPPNTIITFAPHRIQAHGVNEQLLPLLSPVMCGNVPSINYFIAGGFIFAQGDLLQHVPYDPNLYFMGEEITFSARCWTNGYTIYNPGICVLYHYYSRRGSPKHWTDNPTHIELNNRSLSRVMHLMEIEQSSDALVLYELDQYGLGTERSIEEYKQAFGYYDLEVIE